jgi:predicted phage-related endonuclease
MKELSREEWLAKRRNYLGASEVAAVLGEDPRRGPLAVYEAKITGHSTEDNAWLQYGRDIEGAIANFYAAETGREVRDLGATSIAVHPDIPEVRDLGATSIAVHPDIPWLSATLDRQVWRDSESSGPLELKSIDPFGAKIRADEYRDEPLMHHVIQNQMQMACTGAKWGAIGALFPGYQLTHVDMDFDAEAFEAAYPILEEFWDRVQRKDPPPPDQLPGTLDVVRRLYSNEDGTTVAIAPETFETVELWEAAKARKNTAEKEAKQLEALIRAELGDATFGQLGDGTLLTLKTTHRKAYTAKASSFRTLRRTRPKGR